MRNHERGARRRDGDATRRGRDRRASARYAAAEFRAWLGCWDEGRFEVKAVKVLNISRGGMAVEMESRPLKQQDVWLRLHGDPGLPTVRAHVVDVAPGACGRYRTHLEFSGPCPERFYRGVLRGLGQAELSAGLELLCGPRGISIANRRDRRSIPR